MSRELLDRMEELLAAEDIMSVADDFHDLQEKFEKEHRKEEGETAGDKPAEAASEKDKSSGESSSGDDTATEDATLEESQKPQDPDIPESDDDSSEEAEEQLASQTDAPKPEPADGPGDKSPEPEEDNADTESSITEESSEKHGTADEQIEQIYEASGIEETPVEETSQAAEATEAGKEATADKETKTPDFPSSESDLMNRYQKLVNKFESRYRKEWEKQKAEYAKNKGIKQKVLEELEQLINEEENIGRAFARFNELRDLWKTAGPVSNKDYQKLNNDYHKLVERFFYNINIYKELKEHDLRKNKEEKEAVIKAQEKLLEEVSNIQTLEVNVKLNQERWGEIGPTFKEDWENLKERFWNATRAIYAKIQEHYDKRREDAKVNIEKRKDLINQARHLANLNLKNHGKWKEKTEEIKAIQKKWKNTGFVPRDISDELWEEFRGWCDQFFDQKRAYYAELKEIQNQNKKAKSELLEEAEKLKDSTDWKNTTQRMIQLQKDWKKVGPAHQRDENRLWHQFREACDHFFNSKKEHFKEQREEEKENLKKKEELIEEIKNTEISPEEGRKKLREFSDRWREIGFVPFKEKDRINKEYEKAMNAHYKKLDIDRSERDKMMFKDRIENLSKAEQPKKLLNREKDAIRHKINKLESDIMQFENNLGFFSDSSGASKLKQDVERKIERTRDEIEKLEEQMKMIERAKH